MPANYIVTLDGPAGVGKSTLAKMTAEMLKIPYLDTGAMFRALALQTKPTDTEKIIKKKLDDMHFSLRENGQNTLLLLNGRPLGAEIRTEEIGMQASRLGKYPFVREVLKRIQRQISENSSLVVEGRDMGTEVFPDARFKFYLTASPEERAKRRLAQLKNMGKNAELGELMQTILKRDTHDTQRAIAPLRPAPDAVLINTSSLDIDQVLEKIRTHIKQKTSSLPDLSE